MSERDVTLPDGRTLHVYDEGDPNGKPVLVHNGTPMSGLLYERHVEDARTRGIRLIGYDRAGYGASTAKPGRTVAGVTGDIAQALDALGIDRFATWGISGGGPHALACGALLSDRCVWQGVHDLMVPPDHGRWLAARIPGVEAHVSEDDGHLTLLQVRVPEVHAWLVERF